MVSNLFFFFFTSQHSVNILHDQIFTMTYLSINIPNLALQIICILGVFILWGLMLPIFFCVDNNRYKN